MPNTLTWQVEQRYWSEGIARIAGIDEVGMGALAGPVVAAAVIFSADTPHPPISGRVVIRDSKTLSEKQRQKAVLWIKEHAVAWAVGEATVAEIDELNIRQASHVAMRRAAEQLTLQPDLLLIDGTPAQPHSTIPATTIVDGDATVFSIAAASIIAKVHRDGLMEQLDEQYPGYSLASNKGYGSAAHLAALAQLGPTTIHRLSYAPVTHARLAHSLAAHSA